MKSKYVTFNLRLGGIVSFNRSTIIGIGNPYHDTIMTRIYLDSGAHHDLDVAPMEVQKALAEYDEIMR